MLSSVNFFETWLRGRNGVLSIAVLRQQLSKETRAAHSVQKYMCKRRSGLVKCV